MFLSIKPSSVFTLSYAQTLNCSTPTNEAHTKEYAKHIRVKTGASIEKKNHPCHLGFGGFAPLACSKLLHTCFSGALKCIKEQRKQNFLTSRPSSLKLTSLISLQFFF